VVPHAPRRAPWLELDDGLGHVVVVQHHVLTGTKHSQESTLRAPPRRGGGKRGKEKENEEGFCKIQT
jgi:hypothetical protein